MTILKTSRVIFRSRCIFPYSQIVYYTKLKDIEIMKFWQNILTSFFKGSFLKTLIFSIYLTYKLISISCGHFLVYWRKITIRLHVRKNEKSWDFLKMKLKMVFDYSDKNWWFQYPSTLRSKKNFLDLKWKIGY